MKVLFCVDIDGTLLLTNDQKHLDRAKLREGGEVYYDAQTDHYDLAHARDFVRGGRNKKAWLLQPFMFKALFKEVDHVMKTTGNITLMAMSLGAWDPASLGFLLDTAYDTPGLFSERAIYLTAARPAVVGERCAIPRTSIGELLNYLDPVTGQMAQRKKPSAIEHYMRLNLGSTYYRKYVLLDDDPEQRAAVGAALNDAVNPLDPNVLSLTRSALQIDQLYSPKKKKKGIFSRK